MPHRVFEIPKTEEEAPEREPITFDLLDQTFTCVSEASYRAHLDLIRAGQEIQRSPQSAQGALNVLAWDNYILAVLVPEDRDRFRELTSGRDFHLKNLAVVAQLYQWLQEQYANRPFVQQAGSLNGQPSTGAMLPDAAPSPDSTPAD